MGGFMHEILKVYPNSYKSPLRVQLSGISYCDGDYHIVREKSSTTVIEYVVKGHGFVTQNGEDVCVKEDCVYLLVQGINQNYYSSESDPWEKIFINVGGSLPPFLIEEYGLKDKWLFDGQGMKDLFLKVAEISQKNESGEFDEERVAGIFLEMLARLSKKNLKRSFKEDALKLKEYLDANTNRIVSNSELAAYIFRSTDYCVKLFKSEFGTTPYNYQIDTKLKIVKGLLTYSSLSVGEIAMRVGYNDVCSFSSLFKGKTGVSPRDYRKSRS